MLSEIRNALQNIDLVTGGTGISRQEQEKIIMTIYKKYYPEHFENYEEIIQENLKRELELDLTAKFDFLNQNK